MSRARRVLVRAPSWLGDFCMAEPVFAAIDEACESWTLAGPKRLLALVEERFPAAQRIETDSGGEEGGIRAWREHDAALFLNGSFRSVWTAFRAGIPERIAWNSSGRGLLATCAPKPARESGGTAVGCGARGRFPRRLPRPFGSACIELAGLCGVSVARRVPQLAASESDRASARTRLAEAGIDPDAPFVLVNLGGPPRSAKTPPVGVWGDRLVQLKKDGSAPFVFVCGPGEEERARALSELGTALLDPPVSLGEWLALAELAECGVTPDSGPRHLANAAGLPQTVLFGPTDPRHTAENTSQTVSVRGSAKCSPCHLATCPLGGRDERRCHAAH